MKILNLFLKVCEKIPTLGTQLRVLSTVKATMLGQNMDSEEDQVNSPPKLFHFLRAFHHQ